MNMFIPKIIHQTAPREKSKWHPIWEQCHLSWKENFPEDGYLHMFWDDDDLDNLVENEYNEYWDLYKSFSFDIMKFDFARMCILHKYGGIYADMDMYCYKNFYSDLSKCVNLVQSKDGARDELVQNSLMASTPNNYFFRFCMERIKNNFKEFDLKIDYDVIHNKIEYWNDYVLKTTGPGELTTSYLNYDSSLINILSRKQFNPCAEYYDSGLKTKHMITGRWGKEARIMLKERKESVLEFQSLSEEEYLKLDYKLFRQIDLDNFSFYKSY